MNIQKAHQESGLCNILYAKYSKKCFTQILKTLYEDAMLVSIWGAPIWPPDTFDIFDFSYKCWIHRLRSS